MTPKTAMRFAVFPTWHLATSQELGAMSDAWHAALGNYAPEAVPALAAFRQTTADPAFARAQDALASHVNRIFTLIGREEIDDRSTVLPTLSSLSGLRHQKIERAAECLEAAGSRLPPSELKQEIDNALRIMRSPDWKASRQVLGNALNELRGLLADMSSYQETQDGLSRSFKALKALHDHIFQDGIDHGALADHQWLDKLRTHCPALFDQVIEAADENHIHIRRVGLNDPDFAEELLGWRLNPDAMIEKIGHASDALERAAAAETGVAAPKAIPARTAEELTAPEIDAAKLARGCAAELPAAGAAMRDLKKLGVIAGIVGAAVATAALVNHRVSRRKAGAEGATRNAWQTKLRDVASSSSVSL